MFVGLELLAAAATREAGPEGARDQQRKSEQKNTHALGPGEEGNIAKEQSHRQPEMAAFPDGARLAVGAVLTVTVKLPLCPPARFNELGVTLQTAPVGAPEQVIVTSPVNPGDPVSERL